MNMLSGFIAVFGFLGKHGWPFIREWLFKSKSFKAWLVQHAAQLFYFSLICVMVFVSYHLFIAATTAHSQRNEAERKLDEIQTKYQGLIDSTRVSRALVVKQSSTIVMLNEQTQELSVRLVIYQRWMESCGMDSSDINARPYPTCRSTSRNTTPTPSRSSGTSGRTTTRKKTPKPLPPVTPRKDLPAQVQEIWGK